MRAVAFRPSLTATVRGALYLSGRDGETAPVSRTEKHHEVGSAGWTSKGRTFLPTPNSEEAKFLIPRGERQATTLGDVEIGRIIRGQPMMPREGQNGAM